MAFRIRTLDLTADGRELVRDRDVAAKEISIGRSAENDIHLPDLAVEPQHARIVQSDDGQVSVEATGTLGFTLDGASAREGTIDPVGGGELRFGTYRIIVSKDEDGVTLLSIRQAEDQGDVAFDEKRSFTLAGKLPGRRAMSWIFVLLLLLGFLAVPIYSHLTRGPDPKATVTGDAAWRTGALSLAHHGLEDKCESCHIKPFEAVKDETCQTCHKKVHDHAPMSRQAGARGEYPAGQAFLWKVAHAFGKPGPGSCTTCHTEHEGAGKMEPTSQQFCADCHGSLNERLADTKLGNAADFGTAHPEFKVLASTRPGVAPTQRISLAAKPSENNGLTFPHDMHLDTRGGVARMAASLSGQRGYGKSLVCSDCHRPTSDGTRFEPIVMEQDCESCHSLVYDKVGSTFRTLRHGNVAQTLADLRAAGPRRTVVAPVRQRPGDYAQGNVYHTNFAPPSAIDPVRGAFARGGVCGECHTPALGSSGISITPVSLTQRYIVNGWFDHRDHREEKCSSCHKAGQSDSASDILVPGVAQCRTCHLGENASKAEVPSSCAMCHSYHPTDTAPRRGRRELGSVAKK